MVIEITKLEQKGFKPLADYILSSVVNKDNIDIKNICYNFAIINPIKEEIDIACSIWNGEVLEPLYVPYIHANMPQYRELETILKSNRSELSAVFAERE